MEMVSHGQKRSRRTANHSVEDNVLVYIVNSLKGTLGI